MQIVLDKDGINLALVLYVQSTRKAEELTEMIQALVSEQKELQTTNEALLEDMRALKSEAEEDKNYIEELKDQIGNYKLNARLKEVCAMLLWKKRMKMAV